MVKLDRDGALVYSTYLGGTVSPDFPLVNPLPVPIDGDSSDGFVAKLDPSGSALVYSTRLGGQEIDGATDIAVDFQGHAYVTGVTSSPDFPTLNAASPSFSGWTDLFVTKLSAGGSDRVYSTYPTSWRRAPRPPASAR